MMIMTTMMDLFTDTALVPDVKVSQQEVAFSVQLGHVERKIL